MGVTGDYSQAISVSISALVSFRGKKPYFSIATLLPITVTALRPGRLFTDLFPSGDSEDTKKMERDSTGAAEKTQPASPRRKDINNDTCAAGSPTSPSGTCDATDVARARWTLLRQVLLYKQTQAFLLL